MAKNKEKDLLEEEYDAYVPSDSVVAAKDYLNGIKSSGYDRRWADRLDSLVDMYVNREEFTYSPEDDLVWQQAKSAALRDGKRAMEDAVASAASLSGGYANSYAATVGAQTYEKAVASVAASADEYYTRAYEKYLDEEKSLLDRLSLIEKLDDAEYSRYMDMLDSAESAYEDEYDRDYAAWRDSVADRKYADEREYQAWRDAVADERYADETAYEREQDRLESEYKAWRDAVSDEQSRADTALSYAKLSEDARQFDTKQDYDKLKAEYDAYVKRTEEEKSDALNAEKEREELEEKMASIKTSPLYKECMQMISYSANKEHAIREMYLSGTLGKGEDALLCLRLLCNEYGISYNKILE